MFREIEPKACGWRKRREEERGGGRGRESVDAVPPRDRRCADIRASPCVSLSVKRERTTRERERDARKSV